MASLRIKNETATELVIETGGAPVKLAARAEQDVSVKELTGKGFAKALEGGQVSFVNVLNPPADTVGLAREVLPGLVVAIRYRAGTLKGRFEQSQKELLRHREAFNKSWKVAEANLAAAQAATTGWPALRRAVKNLLLDARADDPAVIENKRAVAAIEAQINDLKNEDLQVSGRSREAWLADRVAKDQALRAAQEALVKTAQEKADPLAADVASLEGVAAGLAALSKHRAIGQEIPEFGR